MVLETGDNPSPFLSSLEDDRVRYVVQTREALSVGRKRNMLVGLAGGKIIAHFDDDDYYAHRVRAESAPLAMAVAPPPPPPPPLLTLTMPVHTVP